MSLPEELLVQIFSQLNCGDIFSVSITCSFFNRIVHSNVFYRQYARRLCLTYRSPSDPVYREMVRLCNVNNLTKLKILNKAIV